MSDAARYREKARAFEQRENWKRAIEAYERAIRADKKARRDVDLSLYNRIGDLYRRIGDVKKAVMHWEAAADGHMESGFYNNAIALCNKVLRNQPNRHSIYLKLGKIGAAKGFLSDARKHFLEYAERMQREGKLDQAFAALIEFADISPDPEIRLVIADQLLDHGWEAQAVEQLRLGWRDLVAEGRDSDAAEVRERILKLAPDRDPEVDPPEEGTGGAIDAEGVIDLPELEPLPFVEPDEEEEAEVEPVDIEPTALDEGEEEPEVVGEELELEPTALEELDEGSEVDEAGLEIEPTALTEDELDVEPAEAVEDEAVDLEPTSLLDAEDVSLEEGPPDDDQSLELVPTSLVEEEELEEHDEGAFLEDLDEPLTGEIESGAAIEEPADATDRLARLQERLVSEGEDPDLLVELADALLETGERAEATLRLREALELFEEQGRFADAARVVDELLQLNINDMIAHQKRVELALRAQDPNRLIEAYLDLADCLDRSDATNKARAVYARVLELDPQNQRAGAALELFGDESEEEAAAEPAQEQPSVSDGSAAVGDYVDLGSLVREDDERTRSTRFRVPAAEPTSESEVNFSEMLSQFKSKVAEAIEEEDVASHYDLGVAYKEMGLIDEAIAEFQIAARGEYRLRAIEMLGACFMEKQDYRIALKVLNRALQVDQYRDEDLVGIFYAMGRAHEALEEKQRALEWYERVMGSDVNFADVASRVSALRG